MDQHLPGDSSARQLTGSIEGDRSVFPAKEPSSLCFLILCCERSAQIFAYKIQLA